jgi:zinc transporter 1/2/3
VRGSFNQNATRSLLTTGILDSLSAGILVYVALINLINPMMTNSRWLRSQRWPMQVASFAAFYAGAGIMAVIGKWA